MLRTLFNYWKKLAFVIINIQTEILLGIFYFVFLLPFGLFITYFLDLLDMRFGNISTWKSVDNQVFTTEDFQTQY